MNLKSSAAGLVTGVKTALRVRKKPGTKGAYYKIRGKELVLAKKQYVTITKVRTVKKQKWYQIAFDFYGTPYKGYVQSKYIKLTKKKVQKKVAVRVLSQRDFEADGTGISGFLQRCAPQTACGISVLAVYRIQDRFRLEHGCRPGMQAWQKPDFQFQIGGLEIKRSRSVRCGYRKMESI